MNRQSGRSVRGVLVVLALIGVVFVLVATFRAGPSPEVSIAPELPGIGKRTPVRVTVSEPKRGLSDFRVEFVQGDYVKMLTARTYEPVSPWVFWGERTASDEIVVDVGSETVENIAEGEALVRVVAERAGTWLRSPDPSVHEIPVKVTLRPPALQVLSSFTYVTQGGSEAVVYTVGPSSVRDGVQAGEHWFPGYPLPGGGDQQRFALFGAPYDLEDRSKIRLVATDAVGNEASASFVDQFRSRPYKSEKLPVSDRFLARVVPPILAQTPGLRDRGDLLENYLAINGELREENAKTLVALNESSLPEFMWNRAFLPMRNAKVTSDFAVRRTYLYNGADVDQQDHLGYDLASIRNAEIQAANNGVVLLSRYFGIYGNAVVIDHGYGLMSLYGHLSSLSVEEGQRVERGDVVGRSGQTGLAGGDHLHFTMLLQGMPVDPREWWDSNWIHDRLVLKLGAALPFKE